MYGRVTWYTGPKERLDDGIEGFKQLLPKIQQLPGYVGSALLVDRETAEAATIVYYQDEQALTESRAAVKQMRDAEASQTDIKSTRVEEYEITIMERAQAGTTGRWGRLITGTADPSKVEEATAMVQRSAAALKQQPGFRSFVSGANRQSGAAFTGTTFDTLEQLDASNAAVVDTREQIRDMASIKDLKIQVFEIAVADVAATSGARV